MISKTNLLHLMLKLGFLFVLFGDFSSVFTQSTPDEDPVAPEDEEEEPYRAGNCIIDSHFVFKEVLEDPTTDELPPYPGTTKYKWNMNCTN